jgi:hypothetical protein
MHELFVQIIADIFQADIFQADIFQPVLTYDESLLYAVVLTNKTSVEIEIYKLQRIIYMYLDRMNLSIAQNVKTTSAKIKQNASNATIK